jgi:hypothetical protein
VIVLVCIIGVLLGSFLGNTVANIMRHNDLVDTEHAVLTELKEKLTELKERQWDY